MFLRDRHWFAVDPPPPPPNANNLAGLWGLALVGGSVALLQERNGGEGRWGDWWCARCW